MNFQYDGGDIYLYRSEALGSNSWEFVQIVYQMPENSPKATSSTCEINRKVDESGDRIFIHCRRMTLVSDNGPEGTFTRLENLNIPKMVDDVDGLERVEMKVGTASTYREGNDLYFVTSRLQVQPGPDGKTQRYMFIYKLKSNWEEVEELVTYWHWQHKEAPHIVKTGGYYYIFTSKTYGWDESPTHYLRATSLEGFKDATDMEVVMHPKNTHSIQSMGSQFCFLQDFGNDQWMFGGRRHPHEASNLFALKYGQHVMTPAKFINGVPHVYWKESFDWQTYNYNDPDFDDHYHGGYGHSGNCKNFEGKFYLEKQNRMRNCGYALTKTRHRCKTHVELRENCPLTCGTC